MDTSDLSREADAWVKLVSAGLATPNEGREALGLARAEDRPDLDEFYFAGRPLGALTSGEDAALFREWETLVKAMLDGHRWADE